MKKAIWLIFLLTFGCTVGPKYCPPEVTFLEGWHAKDLPQDKKELESCIATEWWKVFSDEQLTDLIEKGACHNPTIQAAEAHILAARALKQVAASQLFPQIGANLNAFKTRFSENGPVFAGRSLTEGVSTTTGLPFSLQIPKNQSLYNALIDATWEIDIFGKVRNQVKAKEALIGAAVAEKNDVLLSIFAEIAMNYMQLRSAQKRIKLIEQNIDLTYEKTLIEKMREETGITSELDLTILEAQLSEARAQLPDLYATLYQSAYALSTLVGDPPETLLETLLVDKKLPDVPEQVAIGIRSDLIRRRPDIRIAERELAAATANVGVAVASFFPTFTLGGDIGFQSLKLVNLFTSMSKTWSYGGDISMPLFQGGRLIGNLRFSEAEAVGIAHLYQQTVLTALREAEGNLASFESDKKTLEQLDDVVTKQGKATCIVKAQYREGLVALSDYLDSALALNNAERAALDTKTTTLMDLIALYKSLGGGYEPWDCFGDPTCCEP